MQRYANLFSFDVQRVLAGEVWRVFTWQFVQGGPLSFFFTLLILYWMGGAVEETCGTFDFVMILLATTFGTVIAAGLLGASVLGSFFVSYTLLFVFASLVPEQTIYIFFVLPVKVKWLAWLALAIIAFRIFMGDPAGIPAAVGSALGYSWFYFRFRRRAPRPRLRAEPVRPPAAEDREQKMADHNLARWAEVKRAVAAGDPAAREKIIGTLAGEVTPGVNICPPADFKPEAEDRYCVRCEGFAECSTRFIRIREAEEANKAG